jgi:protoporphyrinogen oxidase
MGERTTVAVIGGGIAGLTAAYDLLKAGYGVDLLERESRLGGLASSFALDDGFLERYYHFLCTNDSAYFALLDELGLRGRLHWRLTKMGQFHQGHLYALGDPWDILTFRPLGWLDKLRFGLTIMAIKRQPADAWREIEDETVEGWMVRRFGRATFEAIHRPLIEMKFGPYAGQVSAAWMWARIHRLGKSRTKVLQLERLGYLEGGTQVLVDALAERIQKLGGAISTGTKVEEIALEEGKARAVRAGGQWKRYDAILSTIPMPALLPLATGAGRERLIGLTEMQSTGVTCLVLRLKRPYTRYFWTNIADARVQIAGVIEYSNLNAGACRNGDHIVYIPQYLPSDSPRYALDDDAIYREYLGYLKLIRPEFEPAWVRQWWVFRDQYAQPICTMGFSKKVLGIRSPVAGLYITDSHQLYPDDRTVSNSIDLGHKAAGAIQEDAHERD